MHVGKDICNNVHKRIKLNAERQRNLRKRKAQKKAQENKTSQASTSTDPTPTPIIYNYNQANEYFKKKLLVIHLVMPAAYVVDYGYMNDLKQVKEKHVSVLAAEFPGIDVVQSKAYVTCTATPDKIKYLVYQAVTALRILPIQHI
jgi:hypothetical protein